MFEYIGILKDRLDLIQRFAHVSPFHDQGVTPLDPMVVFSDSFLFLVSCSRNRVFEFFDTLFPAGDRGFKPPDAGCLIFLGGSMLRECSFKVCSAAGLLTKAGERFSHVTEFGRCSVMGLSQPLYLVRGF